MAEDVLLDFSPRKVPKRKRRSKRDIARYWHTRYGAFLKDGFTDEEATWGANEGLSLKDSDVKDVRKRRRASVRWYMDKYGYTRMKAIEMSSEDLEVKLQAAKVSGKNIFYEVSP